jgi:aminoglycoside phosphotransferase (APT) family kinase protein
VGIEAAKRVAEAAYKLHRTGVRPERRHDIGDELAILRRRLLGLAARHPPLSKRLKRLLRACETVAARLPEAAPTGIHRDFYPDQILMGAERLYLLDLDLYCLGDPALDLGNFVGHLSEQALRAHADPDALLEAEEALIEAYERLSGACIRPAVQVYKTLTLARHIELSTRLAGRGAFTEALLELCERRLEPIQADTPAPPDPVPPDPVPPDPVPPDPVPSDKDRAENAPDAL